MLCLPQVIQQALSGPSLAVGVVTVTELSRLDLVRPVDVVLGVGSGAIFSRR
jgi:hypothetical protein